MICNAFPTVKHTHTLLFVGQTCVDGVTQITSIFIVILIKVTHILYFDCNNH